MMVNIWSAIIIVHITVWVKFISLNEYVKWLTLNTAVARASSLHPQGRQNSVSGESEPFADGRIRAYRKRGGKGFPAYGGVSYFLNPIKPNLPMDLDDWRGYMKINFLIR